MKYLYLFLILVFAAACGEKQNSKAIQTLTKKNLDS